MYSTFLREPQLIGFGYDLEQRTECADGSRSSSAR